MSGTLWKRWIPALALVLIVPAAHAKSGRHGFENYLLHVARRPASERATSDGQALAATAAAGTTNLYTATFDAGPPMCTTEGWTAHDLSAVPGIYFHVDDYAGLPADDYAPIRGQHSLWCGTRADNPDPLVCSYETAPGYGNNWDQTWTTKNCIPVSGDNILDVAMIAQWSSNVYCGWSIEYTADCTGSGNEVWDPLLGGIGELTDLGFGIPVDFDSVVTLSAPVTPSGGGTVKVRLRFQSHYAYSDEDGDYPTNGALHVDSLKVEGLAAEDFELESVGSTQSTDWVAGTVSGFGNYMSLFSGSALVQEDRCAQDMTCMWAAINGSNETYACGGKPAQLAVPKGNARGQFLNNEIWSPFIDLGFTTGTVINLKFSVYRDLPPDNLVFYYWRVRNRFGDASLCPREWKGRGTLFGSYGKDWAIEDVPLGDLVDPDATHLQIALGVIDMCGVWCGWKGSGDCHSHAPLFDSIRLYRVEKAGPQWSIFDFDQFQDSFAETTGPNAGFVRADMARDIHPWFLPGIQPGDSAVVTVADPEWEIADDVALGGKRIYCYVAVWPVGQEGKSEANLSGGPRWPFKETIPANGTTWTKLRLDQVVTDQGVWPNRFCIDLKDDLFTPGDTICFFYSAESTNGVTTYAFGSSLTLTGTDLNQAAAHAAEFTCLPASGGDILYVDAMDGLDNQPLFDTAFGQLNMLDKIDRYDQRGPNWQDINNGLSSRVKDISQLTERYRKILWDCGDWTLSYQKKEDDYALLNMFLAGLPHNGGVYLCGDDVPEYLLTDSSPSAVTFKNSIPFELTRGDHKLMGYNVSPVVNGVQFGCFDGDVFVAFGGCPLTNDFDVMKPVNGSNAEVTYGNPLANPPTNCAVISNQYSNSNNAVVGVILSGFSFVYIRDLVIIGILARADHLYKIITWLGNTVGQPTGTGEVASNSLSQNYPNPFNPQTTIVFSVKERGLVNLRVYNVAGQLVRTLFEEEFAAGAHTKVWDGRDDSGQPVSSGVYFYKLVANNFSQTRKMVVLK